MRKKTILLVDDEAEILEILNNFLRAEGFEIVQAHDGKEGLDVFKKGHRPDMVILDEKMPRMSGSEFLRKLKELKLDVPVIALTGSINLEHLNPTLKEECEHILIKPVRLSELLKLINKILL